MRWISRKRGTVQPKLNELPYNLRKGGTDHRRRKGDLLILLKETGVENIWIKGDMNGGQGKKKNVRWESAEEEKRRSRLKRKKKTKYPEKKSFITLEEDKKAEDRRSRTKKS